MKIDNKDVDIINYLSDNPSKTTTDIAKVLFNVTNGDSNGQEMNKADAFIRSRLNKLVKLGVVAKAKTRPVTYYANREKVYYGDGELHINTVDGKKFTHDMGYFMLITDGDKTVIIKSIEVRQKDP